MLTTEFNYSIDIWSVKFLTIQEYMTEKVVIKEIIQVRKNKSAFIELLSRMTANYCGRPILAQRLAKIKSYRHNKITEIGEPFTYDFRRE